MTANSGFDGISIRTNETGHCVVPMVKWLSLAKAKASLPLVGCIVGTVRRVFGGRPGRTV